MKYLLVLLLLVGCTAPKVDQPHLSKEDVCQQQARLQCMDIGEEDESERDFCKEGSFKECMSHK